MQTLSRAWAGLNLTPGERAFLKLLEGWLFTAIGVGFAAGYQLLMFGNADYAFVFRSAGSAALLSLALAIKKYLAAQTDLPLPEKVAAETAVNAAINQVQKITPPVPTTPPAQTQLQFVPPAPMGTFNLAAPNTTSAIPSTIPTVPFSVQPQLRHFGDTGIVPIPAAGQVPRG